MIEILSIPPLATVQDLGRDGYWGQGLGRAGAMDAVSHRVANLLLGNDPGAATVEITLTPARLRFTRDGAFAIAGAVCGARLDDRALPRIYAGHARAGQVLALGAITAGARLYLALPGGIDVPLVLGSRSTQLREGFGGLDGRMLRAGDGLSALSKAPPLPPGGLSLDHPILHLPQGGGVVRALPSTEHDQFSAAALSAFWSSAYTVLAQSNRQGFRLDGASLDRLTDQELRSHGIVPGIVQVPNGGQPIIQLADSATMGGYPKIATVIAADLHRLGQIRPGDLVRFERITPAEAALAETALDGALSDIRADLAAAHAQHRIWGLT